MARLEAPAKYRRDVNVWVDEAIWGHRLYNDQTPWLILLEFLAVFRHREALGVALEGPRSDGRHENFTYFVPRLVPLRQLVFNNPHIHFIEASVPGDVERWNSFRKTYTGDDDVKYLQERVRSFSHLARVVEFFQSTAVERHRKRRWSSRFVFPYGPDCLYADLPTDITGSPDRRFFARGGELLYLMLNRSGARSEIAKRISEVLLREGGPWDRVVRSLLPEDAVVDADAVSSKIGYLPFAERPEYEALGETWQRLLHLDLPGEALFDPLMRLSALHMLLYALRRANEELGDDREPRFVLEIAAPRKSTLFELSGESLGANRMLSRRAVRAYVESAKADDRWQAVLQAHLPSEAAREYLEERFHWDSADGPPSGDPETIFRALRDYAEKRHQQHVSKVHLEWARQIGLAVARRGVGTWYSRTTLC